MTLRRSVSGSGSGVGEEPEPLIFRTFMGGYCVLAVVRYNALQSAVLHP